MAEQTPPRLSMLQQNWITILLMAAILVAATGIRIWLIQSDDFPPGEGAFFFASVQNLQANSYVPPALITYNGQEIQNIYPPGAFYIVGQIQSLTGIDLFEIFIWYPVVMSVLSILVAYAFFGYYFDTRRMTLLATALFALTPVSIISTTGGTGVVRATAAFFAVATLYLTTRLIEEGRTWQIVPVALIVSLTSLTQPQSGVFVLASIIVLVLSRDLEPGTLLKIIIAIAIAALIVSGWVAFVISEHTFAPLWEALFSQLGTTPFSKVLETLFAPDDPGLAQEALLRVLGALSVIGVFVCIAKGYNEVVIWFVVVLTMPITTPANVIIPLSIVMAICIDYIILTGISSFRVARKFDPETGELVARANNLAIYVSYIAVVVIFLYTSVNVVAAQSRPDFALGTINDANEEAMEWVAEETPPGSTFYVITGVTPWEGDEISDWFPVIAERFSYATVSGTEWIGELEYENRIDRFQVLQGCTGQNAACLNDEALRLEADVPDVYVYVADTVTGRLRANLLANPNFTLVYPFRSFDSRDGVLIFERNN
ncbi:MAG: glycosyltransferase family 39 protein [Chloroflexota bacterium]